MEGDLLMSMDVNAYNAEAIADSILYSPEIYEDLDACTISTKNKLTVETLCEIPYVLKRNRVPKIKCVVCKQCGAPVKLDESYCPWCKVPYEWVCVMEDC